MVFEESVLMDFYIKQIKIKGWWGQVFCEDSPLTRVACLRFLSLFTMKTNKTYKLVVHKKGFGGSGEFKVINKEYSVKHLNTHLCLILSRSLPLYRRWVGCEPKSLPPSESWRYHWDRTPNRRIQVSRVYLRTCYYAFMPSYRSYCRLCAKLIDAIIHHY